MPVQDDQAGHPASYSGPETRTSIDEVEVLRAEVRRLETELGRYQAHAARTSTLFLSVTDYAEKVREGARRDADLALRKARARVDKLDAMARDLERTEREVVAARDELARVQALTEETRARLAAFLTTGLESLSGAGGDAREDTASLSLGNLDETLEEQLHSASIPTTERRQEVETSEQ